MCVRGETHRPKWEKNALNLIIAHPYYLLRYSVLCSSLFCSVRVFIFSSFIDSFHFLSVVHFYQMLNVYLFVICLFSATTVLDTKPLNVSVFFRSLCVRVHFYGLQFHCHHLSLCVFTIQSYASSL